MLPSLYVQKHEPRQQLQFMVSPAIRITSLGRGSEWMGDETLKRGIQGGRSYGLKNERGAQVADKRVSIPDFNATIAYALGVPLDQILYSPSKRSFTVADKGKPITELFG